MSQQQSTSGSKQQNKQLQPQEQEQVQEQVKVELQDKMQEQAQEQQQDQRQEQMQEQVEQNFQEYKQEKQEQIQENQQGQIQQEVQANIQGLEEQNLSGQTKFEQIQEKLKQFGYYYNEQGVLRTNDDKEFQFIDQQHYNALGDIVLSYIQAKLQSLEFDLKEVWIPEHIETIEKCNIYMTRDILENQNGCLVLLCGTAPVLAGQWARSVCINHGLETGTVFPLVREAKKQNWSCIILNPNLNRGESGNSIPYSDESQVHCNFVWQNYIQKSNAKYIYIVAHSYGGYNVMQLMNLDLNTFIERVRAVAFTDASVWKDALNNQLGVQFLAQRTVDYVASDFPLGTILQKLNFYSGCAELSAGHNKHEYTTGFATPEIIKFFNNPEDYMQNVSLYSDLKLSIPYYSIIASNISAAHRQLSGQSITLIG